MASEPAQKPRLGKIYTGVRYGTALLSTTILATYWGYGGAWRNGLLPDKAALPVFADIETTQREAPARLAELRHSFVPVIITYWGRDNGGLKSTEEVRLAPQEIALAKEKLKNFEVICDHRDDNGFYGCSLKDKNTGKVYVCFAGANFSGGLGEIAKDADDVFFSTAGSEVGQVASAKFLVDEARKRTGQSDVTLIGHSLGGYCSLYLRGSGYAKGDVYTFDTSGVTPAMIHQCAKMSDISESEVEKNFRDNVVGVSTHPSWYSRAGTPAGRNYVFSDEEGWLLQGHSVKAFLAKFEDASALIHRGDGGNQSPGPLGITGVLVTALAVSSALELKARRNRGSSSGQERA